MSPIRCLLTPLCMFLCIDPSDHMLTQQIVSLLSVVLHMPLNLGQHNILREFQIWLLLNISNLDRNSSIILFNIFSLR